MPKQINDWQVDESRFLASFPRSATFRASFHAAPIDGDGETVREDDAPMKTNNPCKGAGKSWSVNKEGKPICPGCHRAFSTVAGYGKTVRDVRIVPPHDRTGPQDVRTPRRDRRTD